MKFSDRMIIILAIAGLICSWGSWIVLSFDAGSREIVYEPGGKPLLFYALHSIGILSVIGAGLLSLLKGKFRLLTNTGRTALWVLIFTSIIWGLMAYGLNGFFSMKAFGATGPMVWISCMVFMAGMDRSAWDWIDPVIRTIAYITAGLALMEMISIHFVVSNRWFSPLVRYMILLMWFGGWTFLTIGESTGWRTLLRCFPYFVFILSCIITQTRSWLLMSTLLFISIFFIIKRTSAEKTRLVSKRLVIPYLMIIIFLTLGLLAREPLLNAWAGFQGRMTVDSRTGQYEIFFSQVPLSDLFLGRGPNGYYNFGARGKYQFFDNAYIWMAFIGGMPILVSYFILIILPGIKAFKQGAREKDTAAAALIILWCLACTGLSTYSIPSLTPYCYLLSLLAGRCHLYIAENQHI